MEVQIPTPSASHTQVVAEAPLQIPEGSFPFSAWHHWQKNRTRGPGPADSG